MKKLLFLLFVALFTAEAAHSQQGVVINGVTWAENNVAKRRTFTDNPWDYGYSYKFKKAQKVCPKGWSVPSHDDIRKLRDQNRVEYGWTEQAGVNGMLFTDKTTGQSIFLPAAGFVNAENTIISTNTQGIYWSERTNYVMGHTLHFDDTHVSSVNDVILFSDRQSVRCVKEE